MGKASRRRTASREFQGSTRAAKDPAAQPAPFERRPFEGLAGETDWVALREILPAATAQVTVRPEHVPDGAPSEVTVATVLPLAWPGLHRADGTVLIGTAVRQRQRRRVARPRRGSCSPRSPPSPATRS